MEFNFSFLLTFASFCLWDQSAIYLSCYEMFKERKIELVKEVQHSSTEHCLMEKIAQHASIH